MGYTVAVVGATGAVGAQMIKMLEESTLPIDKIRYLASARSAGKVLQFKGQDVTIEETTEDAFEGVDIALFSAGGSTSAKYAPYAVKAEILPSGGDKKHYPIAFNALAQIDVFTENDYTYEEMKMTNETKKIMEDDSIAVSATCVRIPVLSAHSESVYIETKEVAPIDEVKAAIAEFPGAVLEDDVAHQVYPQAVNAVGSRDTFVGRIRKDLDAEKGIHMWVVSDNLLKGAAWNSVQIAETLHERGLVRPTAELKFELK